MKGELPKGRLIVKAKGAMICSASTFPELLKPNVQNVQAIQSPGSSPGSVQIV